MQECFIRVHIQKASLYVECRCIPVWLNRGILSKIRGMYLVFLDICHTFEGL
jgi:hypothetical protein